jgi:protein involved in polysaccharide export with SLBB domain/cytochrome c-type biogenesis protein CcmH/NrfG
MNKAFPALTSSLLAILLLSPSINALASQEPKAPDKSASAYKASEGNGSSRARESSEESDAVQAQKLYESGMSLFQAGKIDEAIGALSAAVKLRPEDAQTHYALGMAYAQAKSYKEALDSFKRAVKFKPDWPEANFKVGMMAYVLGRRSQAVESYRQLLKMESPLANTLYRIINEDNTSTNGNEAAKNEPVKSDDVAAPQPKSPPINLSGDNGARENLAAKPAAKDTGTVASDPPPATKPAESDATLTSIYRVAIGDILDIRLLNSTTPRSTLYTVIEGGVIDFPIAGGPISVAGLTTDEIQNRISSELRRRAVESNSMVAVGVRQYSSHPVIVTGLVNNPGTRSLRREAVPLYVLMAEVQPRSDAGRVSILRAGKGAHQIDLTNSAELSTVVLPGDVISFTSRPQEFYYIGGRVNYPGQKPFQSGITLLQAILAAGGLAQNDHTIDLSREGTDGRLSTTRYNLKEIKSGKAQDPKLQPGDRIEVVH